MKLIIVVSFFGLFLLNSCQKRLETHEMYHPEIQLVSVVNLPSGAVQVTAKVIHDGAAPIRICGFAFASQTNFDIEENQKIASLNGDEFTVVYPPEDFVEGTSYYFRAFALTYYGYTESDIKSLSNVVITPIEAPCSHPINRYRIGAGFPFYPIYGTTQVSEGFYAVEYSNDIDPVGKISIRFKNSPITGTYATTTLSEPSPGTAKLTIGWPNPGAAVDGAGLIYVNKISDTQFKVEACNIPWTTGGTNQTNFDLHWICNY